MVAGDRGGRRSVAPSITPDRVAGEAVALAVPTYVHNTLTKLGVRSRCEAVSRVLCAGIVPACLTQEAAS